MRTINIIGAGKLGKVIGKLLAQLKPYHVQGIMNSTSSSTEKAIEYIGSGNPIHNLSDLPKADITLICVGDELIPQVAQKLADETKVQRNSTIIHFSGVLGSDALSPLKKFNCNLVSVHPMRSFADPSLSFSEFEGTFCAIEGNDEGKSQCMQIFRELRGIPYELSSSGKATYHAAAVFSANYLVALSKISADLLKASDVDPRMAMKVILSMMQGVINNLSKTLSPEKSLTGPIQRGDTSTLQKHLDAISDTKVRRLYSLLGEVTLNLTSHSPTMFKRVSNTLHQKPASDTTPRSRL